LEPATAYKRLDLAIQTLAELRRQGLPATLEVVGDGAARSHYEELAERLGVDQNVRFSGAKHGQELVKSYSRASCLLMPTEFDSLPTVILESFACETPVVTTPVGEIGSLVADGMSGLTVPVGDLDATVDAAKSILLDPIRRAELGRRARVLVEDHYSSRRLGDSTVNVFERVLGTRFNQSRRNVARRPIVALVTPYYPPRSGGVEVYVAELARRLADRGDFLPIVITTDANSGANEGPSDNGAIRIIRLGVTLTASNSPLGVTWPFQLRKLFKDERVDIVNVHSPVPGLADAAVMSAGDRPVVFTYHSGSMTKGNKFIDPVLIQYERLVLPYLWSRSSAVVAVSPTSMASNWPAASVISPGVDIDRFVPGSRATQTPTVLYVGRIERSSRWKGIDVLIRAFAEVKRHLPDARLELVGDGDAVTEYRSLAHLFGLASSTSFRGTLNGEALVQAYRDASVVVLPSNSDAESFGMCLIEAMASGTPVVGSRIGGIPYVIEDGVSGLLVEPGDVGDLAQACIRVLTEPDLQQLLSSNGRCQAATRHPWCVTVEQYSDLFSRLLDPEKSTAGAKCL
jgi:glycosyltransferase involved in cell wall biosynthesis